MNVFISQTPKKFLQAFCFCIFAICWISCKQTRRLQQDHEQNDSFSNSVGGNEQPEPHLNISILDPEKTSLLKLSPQEEAEHLLDDSNYQIKLNLLVENSGSSEKTIVYVKSLPIQGLAEEGLALSAAKIKPLDPTNSPKVGKVDIQPPRIKNFKIEHEKEIFGPSSQARDHLFPDTDIGPYKVEGEVVGKLEDGSLIKLNLEEAKLTREQAEDLAERELAIITKDLNSYKKSIKKPMVFSDTISEDFIAIPTQIKQLRDGYFSKKPTAEIRQDINSAKTELRDGLKLFSDSADLDRVAPVYALVRKIYKEEFGVDDYTWKTDGENEFGRGHYYEVASGLKQPISARKAIAAFMHDLERFFPKSKVSYLNTNQLTLMGKKSSDGTLRKKALHPRNSAKLADLILKDYHRLSVDEKSDIFDLILYHDAGEKGLTLNFGFGGRQTAIEVLPPLKSVNSGILEDLRDLSDADALAFFRKTMPHFMSREIAKYKKNYKKSYRTDVSAKEINEYLEARVVETLFGRISKPEDKLLVAKWVEAQKNFDTKIDSHFDYVKRSIRAKVEQGI